MTCTTIYHNKYRRHEFHLHLPLKPESRGRHQQRARQHLLSGHPSPLLRIPGIQLHLFMARIRIKAPPGSPFRFINQPAPTTQIPDPICF